MINLHKLQPLFFFAILGGIALLALLIFWPFLTTIALSVMMTVVLLPVYTWIRRMIGGSENLAALLTLLFFLIVIMLPLTFIGVQIFQEAQGIYTSLSSSGGSWVSDLSNTMQGYANKIVPGTKINLTAVATTVSGFVVDRLGGFFSGTVNFVVKLALALVALFYFLRDGEKFRAQLQVLSPLPRGEDEKIIQTMKSGINSVVLGSFIIAIIQGAIAGIGFWIFGVPNPTLWGTAAAVASLVPGVGTALVWIPASIYLLAAHSGYAWLGQFLYSIFVVASVDNFVAPYIFARGVQVHPLLILFSILGALSLFGPEGVLLGPLILSLLFALVRVYQSETKLEEGKKA